MSSSGDICYATSTGSRRRATLHMVVMGLIVLTTRKPGLGDEIGEILCHVVCFHWVFGDFRDSPTEILNKLTRQTVSMFYYTQFRLKP